MYRKGAIILPVLIVIIVISLAAVAGLMYLYQNEHTQNIQLKEQIVELDSRQRITEGKLDESKKIATELSTKLQESKDKIDSLTEELTQEKTKHSETAGQLEQFKSDLEQQKSLRQDLETRLSQAQEESKKIKEQIKLIKKQKNDLEEKMKSLESGSQGVELGTVVVNNETGSAVKPPVVEKYGKKIPTVKPSKSIEGKVMVINKEFNFAVINLGSKDDISVGDEFSVIHEGKSIGDIKVEKVHEAMSAAGFSADLRDVIKENDKIVKKVK